MISVVLSIISTITSGVLVFIITNLMREFEERGVNL